MEEVEDHAQMPVSDDVDDSPKVPLAFAAFSFNNCSKKKERKNKNVFVAAVAGGGEIVGEKENEVEATLAERELEERNQTQAVQCREEGNRKAESNDMMGALNSWAEGLALNPNDFLLHELRAQGLLFLEQYWHAIQAAEIVVELAPNWWEGHQTLARCQREYGEAHLALESYDKATRLLLEAKMSTIADSEEGENEKDKGNENEKEKEKEEGEGKEVELAIEFASMREIVARLLSSSHDSNPKN